MIIRRDAMVHNPHAAALAASAVASSPSSIRASYASSPASANLSTHITTDTINNIAAKDQKEQEFNSSSPSTPQNYSLNPLQQREAMQKETWEKERKGLLKKAGNNQGESVERLLANYLAV